MEEDDLLLRHCKTSSSRTRNGAPHKGHNYASAHKRSHNLRTSSEIATNNHLNFEEGQFTMDNYKRNPIGDQTKPKKSEITKTSPSIIARLMGLKEFPTNNKETEKKTSKEIAKSNNKKSEGALQKKPSLSGLLSSKNKNVEFKDVFEVIEERDRRQQQKTKEFEFESDFESYRDNVVKNIEKYNPLFAKHLLELKCYPPHLHKGMVSRLKSGYGYDCVPTQNPKVRNFDRRNDYDYDYNYDYNCHDHIVVLDPKMGNTDEQNFYENLQNRRSKMWRFETFERGRDENCNGSVLKLQKIRKNDPNLSNEGMKSLAEVLATPDMESLEKNFDLRKYHRKNLRRKFAREGYYEKSDGSFVKLPLKSDVIEREDVMKVVRDRKYNSRESRSINGDFESRNDFETEEKMLFTIDEGQRDGSTTSLNFGKGVKKHRNEKRSSTEEKDECFSVLNFSRITNSTESEIPSPISVLESNPMETASSRSSFLWKPESDLHETDTQITEELQTFISSDDDNEHTANINKTRTLNLMRDQEEREYLYLLDILIESGIHRIRPNTPQNRCHSREFPVDRRVFDRLEKRYRRTMTPTWPTWSRSDRRLFFDLANSALANVLAPLLDVHPWVRSGWRVGPGWGKEGLVERVWLVLLREREKGKGKMGNEEEDTVLDLSSFEDLGDEVNVVGKQIERMLTDEMLEEIISGFALS